MSTPEGLRYMPSGRLMQCKDIPDQAFLDAVQGTPGTSKRRGAWRMRWNVQATLEVVLGPIPERLFLAKARKLMTRRLLGGCPCGCRGDYHLPADCDDWHCCIRYRTAR